MFLLLSGERCQRRERLDRHQWSQKDVLMLIELQRSKAQWFWRETQTYFYEVEPFFMEPDKPSKYGGGLQSYTKREGWSPDGRCMVNIEDLINSGSNFVMKIQANEGELEGWLERYATEHPKEAVSLLAKALQIAAGKLADEPHSSTGQADSPGL